VFEDVVTFPINQPYPKIGGNNARLKKYNMKKVKLVEKNLRTAMGTLEDGAQIWFSKTNSSWYDYGIANRTVGEEFQVNIAMSNKGNAYVERLNADKFIAEMNIEAAMARNLMLTKQIASL
jgi:hypothetical protein